MELFRQEYWSELQFPFPGYLPDLGIEPRSSVVQADSFTTEQLEVKIAPDQKQPQSPPPVNRHTKMWYIHITEYYLGIKRDTLPTHATMWMHLQKH